MNRYENGKMYKITDIGYNKCYIGSTCEQLSKRMSRHRKDYNDYLNEKDFNKHHTTSTLIFEEYGLDNVKIELIENYPCNSKGELLKREGHYIQTIDCVNRCIAGRDKLAYNKERYEHNKETILQKNKEYREQNQEQIKEMKKAYREANQDKIKEKKKKYREDNIERLKEKGRQYYLDNKKKWNEIIVCECGSSITRGCLNKHLNTTKHKTLIQELNKSSE